MSSTFELIDPAGPAVLMSRKGIALNAPLRPLHVQWSEDARLREFFPRRPDDVARCHVHHILVLPALAEGGARLEMPQARDEFFAAVRSGATADRGSACPM